jgi:hypothetical protein
MFELFNMGIGFCYVVEAASAERMLSVLKQHGRTAQVIGSTAASSSHIAPQPGAAAGRWALVPFAMAPNLSISVPP